MPPGQYQARLTVQGQSQTQDFNVLIDPRVAAQGVSVAALLEQWDHNKRMNAMVAEVGTLVERVRTALTSADENLQSRLDPIAEELITGPIRYDKPGLQAHISYLRGMTTRSDQVIGRDVIERFRVLRTELDAITAEVDRVLGPGD